MAFYRFHIDSPLPPDAVRERVEAMTARPVGFLASLRAAFSRRAPESPPFIGTIGRHSFRIWRDIRYRNSFLPVVRGEILAIASGSRLQVTMTLHWLVTLFMLVWFGGVGLALVAGRAGTEGGFLAVPLGMLLFGVALVSAAFIPEAVRARRLLEQAAAGVPPPALKGV